MSRTICLTEFFNPYWGTDFFSFFQVLFERIFHFSGPLASDEVQILVLISVAISCGVIGPFLVLKRMTMFANSLSHTVLLGIAAAYLFASTFWGGGLFDLSTLLCGALIAALITACFTHGLVHLFRLQEDASIGLVFTALFALGITLVTVFMRDVHLGLEAVMGNIDVLQSSDLKLTALLAAFNLTVVCLFYRKFQLASFDQGFAKSFGISCHFMLLLLTSITCVAAFRSVGVLLVLGFLVGPYLIARLFCHRLSWLLFFSPLIGVIASLSGVALARHFLSVTDLSLSTGGIVVSLIGLFYVLSIGIIKFFTPSPKSATL